VATSHTIQISDDRAVQRTVLFTKLVLLENRCVTPPPLLPLSAAAAAAETHSAKQALNFKSDNDSAQLTFTTY